MKSYARRMLAAPLLIAMLPGTSQAADSVQVGILQSLSGTMAIIEVTVRMPKRWRLTRSTKAVV